MKKKFTKEQILKMIPVKNINIEQQISADSKKITLIIKRKKSLILNLISYLLMIPDEKKIELDKTGTIVYNLCDGTNTVNDIINKLKKELTNSNYHELELSVINYLILLAKKNIIGLSIKKTENG
jgi:hypothetical protein